MKTEENRDRNLEQKLERLRNTLKALGRSIVAYSGGLDGGFLLAVAKEILGEDVLGILAVSPSLPRHEKEEALRFAQAHRLPCRMIETRELENTQYGKNTPDRCFYCKTELFRQLRRIGNEEGFSNILDGCNVDDLGDHRPGRRAAKAAGVRSPLLEANLTKSEIRTAARQMGLEIWDKPSFACLGSRLPYGEEITVERLHQVEECEEVLRNLGLRQFRVRYHGPVARIEAEPESFPELLKHRQTLVREFLKNGFQWVALDLEGYRTGSLNRSLTHPERKPASRHPPSEPTWMKKWRPKTFGEGWTTAYIDGASWGNPGPASSAFILFSAAGKELTRSAKAIGRKTNNVAEYAALIDALGAARELGCRRLTVLTDSELIVRQIKGSYRVKSPHLIPLFQRAKTLTKGFDEFGIEAVPREENRLADYMARRVLESAKDGPERKGK